MNKRIAGAVVCTLGLALLFGGCGNAQREATEAAVNAAQTAIHSARNAAQQFVPDQTKAAQDALQTAKDSLAKGDYGAALSSAKEAAQKAKDALRAASAKKEEWTNLRPCRIHLGRIYPFRQLSALLVSVQLGLHLAHCFRCGLTQAVPVR